MKTKDYQKPTTKVVQLQHQCHILAGSEVRSAGVQDYTKQSDDDWDQQ